MASVQLLGFDEAQAALRRLGQERMNIAIAAGLNRTAVQMQRKTTTAMTRQLDRPTPFTLQAVKTHKADRNRLNAVVYVQPIQAKYLKTMVHGGRLATNLTPVIRNVRLDAYGNLPNIKGGAAAVARAIKLQELSQRYGRRRGRGRQTGLPEGMFIGRVFGVKGLWQRVARGKLNLLLRFEENAERERRWDFYGIGERTARERLQNDIREAIAREIAALTQ